MSTFESESCGASSVFLPVGKWVNSRFIFWCPSTLLTLLYLAADLNSTSQLHYAGSLMRLSILVSIIWVLRYEMVIETLAVCAERFARHIA
jgi:hypothetical protein